MLIAPHFETDSITLPGTWHGASDFTKAMCVRKPIFPNPNKQLPASVLV